MNRRRNRIAAALVSTLLLTVASCTNTPRSGDPSREPNDSSGATASPASLDPQPSHSEPIVPAFPYGSFANPTVVDNPYLPLVPGTRWVWDGVTMEDDEEITHQIITVITDMTKVIDGVEAVVGWDEDWSAGQLVEVEIFFAAQDDEGNVWRLGEYPEVYEKGLLVEAPAWLAGIDGALAGHMMRAMPREGEPSYGQGWGPAVGWADRGQVIEAGIQDCVTFGCYEDVIAVEEWDASEPLARQLKFHAPGVGVIRVDWSGSADQSQEMLQLIEFGLMSADQLTLFRNKALALEAHAYQILPAVYGGTAPMTPRT